MKVCALCRKGVEVDRSLSRKDTCPHCGGDLHICLNCRFYSETSHNKCIEPRAEFQRSRDRANFCDYFQFREGGGSGGSSTGEAGEAKRKLDELFGGK
jgi:rRNA maturation protein Nop10